ncbi:MAG TPA: fatty acid--CoA ligase [Acetobacteraceae bacterium]|nr:fatty acid--CoA ligase [Acetobacteraceae bacterium]
MLDTLIDSLAATVIEKPSKPAFVFESRTTDFATFDRHTNNVASALRAAGIRPGERVAYIGKNSDIYFEALYGAIKAGVVMVPINWRLAGPEIAAIIDDSEARLLIVGPEFAELVASHRDAMPRIDMILAAEGHHPAWPDFTHWRDSISASCESWVVSADDIALQLYTSGTTGRPKGVMLTHRNFTSGIRANRMADLPWNRWREDDATIQAMPVSHISGTGWGIMAAHYGATCFIQRQFDLDETFDMIERHAISKIFLVPAALQFLVRHPRAGQANFTRIRDMAYGASPMPLPLLREAMRVMGCGFVQFYGMTETTGTIVALPPEDHLPEGSPRMRAAGKPLPWVEVRILDASGAEVPTGQVGEIVTRSDANMAGYWRRPEETARTLANGWLRTGDAGYLDADGYLYIHDRVKDMIISGGENVYPAEVENALSEHPAIAEVAVIGVPDDTWGEAVKAVIVLRPGATLAADELIAWSRQRIAAFKAPRSVDFVDLLPRNASGKILKRSLRAPFWEAKSRQVN